MVYKDKDVTMSDVKALDRRLSDLVDSLNQVGKQARKYVDDADAKQDKGLKEMEKRLTDLIDTKIKNYDGLVRRVVKTEFAKIGKRKK